MSRQTTAPIRILAADCAWLFHDIAQCYTNSAFWDHDTETGRPDDHCVPPKSLCSNVKTPLVCFGQPSPWLRQRPVRFVLGRFFCPFWFSLVVAFILTFPKGVDEWRRAVASRRLLCVLESSLVVCACVCTHLTLSLVCFVW